jgi:hypothetical protein
MRHAVEGAITVLQDILALREELNAIGRNAVEPRLRARWCCTAQDRIRGDVQDAAISVCRQFSVLGPGGNDDRQSNREPAQTTAAVRLLIVSEYDQFWGL